MINILGNRCAFDHFWFIWYIILTYISSTQKYVALCGSQDYEDFIAFWDECWASTNMHVQQTPLIPVGENKRIFILQKPCTDFLQLSCLCFPMYCCCHSVKSAQIRSYFSSVFSCVWTEYRKIWTKNKSVFGHFSRIVHHRVFVWPPFWNYACWINCNG